MNSIFLDIKADPKAAAVFQPVFNKMREMFGNAEVIDDVIVKGVSLKAFSLTRQEARKNIADTASRMREIRAEILGIEDRLTRSQKDRLYVMFRQVEGMNDAGMITLMENLIREIRNA